MTTHSAFALRAALAAALTLPWFSARPSSQAPDDPAIGIRQTAQDLLARSSVIPARKGSVKHEFKQEAKDSPPVTPAALFALPDLGRAYRLTITSEAIGRTFVTQRIMVPTAYLLDRDLNVVRAIAESDFKEAWKRVTIKRYLRRHTLTVDEPLRHVTHLLVTTVSADGLAAVKGGSTGIVTLSNVPIPRSAEGKIEVKIE